MSLNTTTLNYNNGTSTTFFKMQNTTEASKPTESPGDYGATVMYFLLSLLAFSFLVLFFRMCCLYLMLRRRRRQLPRPNRTSDTENGETQHEIQDIGHPFSYLAHEGFDNNGFVPPPPRYDDLFKGDEPPPMYENVTTQAAANIPADSIVEHPRRDVMAIDRPLQSAASQLRNSVRSQHVQTSPAQSTANLAIPSGVGMLPTGAFGTSILPMNEILEDEASSVRPRTDTVCSVAMSLPPVTEIPSIPPMGITTARRTNIISHQTTQSSDREDLNGSQYFDAEEPISQERLI